MTSKQLLSYMMFLKKRDIQVVSLNDIHLRFPDENRNDIMSEMSRFVKSRIIGKLAFNFYLNPFLEKGDEKVLIDLAKKIRTEEFFYLSLDYRAYELNIITQRPNVMTFVTNGLSKKYVTTKINLSFVKQKESRKGVFFDKKRGIYTANKQRVIYDAKIHKLNYLLDLITEKEKAYEER